MVGALFGPAVELGQEHDGDVELLGQELELAAHLGGLDLPVLGAAAGGLHELEVVDSDDVELAALLEASAAGLDLSGGEAGVFEDVQVGVLQALDAAAEAAQSSSLALLTTLPMVHRRLDGARVTR